MPALPKPATIIAVAALVVATTGGAFAAGGLINGASIKNGTITGNKLKAHTLTGTQINLKKLGTVPRAAVANFAPLPGTLPSHKSLKGVYAVEGTGTVIENSVSYAVPLASIPATHFIKPGSPAPAQCPGTVTNPLAAPGNLCVYADDFGGTNLTGGQIYDPMLDSGTSGDRLGFGIVLFQSPAGQNAFSNGSWAVTAP